MSKDKDKQQDNRRDRYVLSDNTGITVVLPESAYECIRRFSTDGKDVNDNSKLSGNRK